jgi:hypothetical protein
MTDAKPVSSTRHRLAVAARIKRGTAEINGETFHVRGLTSTERTATLEIIRASVDTNTLPDYRGIVRMGLIEEDGAPVFQPDEDKAVVEEFFATIDGKAVEVLGQKVLELAGLRAETVEGN